mgnify:FL=1
MTAREKKKKLLLLFILAFFLLFLAISIYMMNLFNMFPQKYYLAKDFGIETIKSEVDFNKNGTDDYTDILLGARKDAENHPVYNGKYYDEGYPPDNIGVCTDVIWRAFKNAGYSLRDMIDNDIKRRPEEYKNIKTRDKNIDFRRVVNLEIFFDEYALTLTSDISEIEEWQPGDIVIFNNGKHIGIVSDKRNANGEPYIIHNGGQPNREEDYLKRGNVYKHYRFDASRLPNEISVKWAEK